MISILDIRKTFRGARAAVRFLIWCQAFAPILAGADWVNLTGAETAANIAEINVFDDRVEVALEVYIGELASFKDLVPDDWLQEFDIDREPLAARLQRFSEQGLRFVTDTGETLQADLRLVEPRLRKDRFSPFAGTINPYTRQRVPEAPADKRVLYAELVYPFGDSTPRNLTMSPPLDEDGRPEATIGFIVYHKTVPVIDFRYLGAPSTLTLDPDPWYSRFDNPNLKRHHKDALMSFLYVEPYEVRHEILTRVKDLSEWMDLELRGDQYIELDELEPLKQRIGKFLLTRNPLMVDGKSLKPILDRTDYVRVGLTGIKIMDAPERLDIASAILGVIITYITGGMPQQVTVNWELFTDQIQRVPATAIDPAGPLASYVEPTDSMHTWTNYLQDYELPTVQQMAVRQTLGAWRLPVVTLACLLALFAVAFWIWVRARNGRPLRWQVSLAFLLLAAGAAAYPVARVNVQRPALVAGEIGEVQATALLQTLLKNVYRAFDFREEEDVYDKLALSVSGELLTDIYLQNRRSLAVQQAGGAQAKVGEVAVEAANAQRLDGPGLRYLLDGRWTALGSVGHWGHVHQRKNRYQAEITVAAVDGVWKIVGLDIRDEQRIDQLAQESQPEQSASSGSNADVLSGSQTQQ